MSSKSPFLEFFDVQKPFYKPLWLRVALVGICAGWGLIELLGGQPFWALLFGVLGAYLTHQFFFAFDPKDDTGDDAG